MAKMTISRHCTFCNTDYTMEVDAEGYGKWQSGMLIQQAFPTLPVDEREQIMTGIHGKCFDEAFAEPEFGGD